MAPPQKPSPRREPVCGFHGPEDPIARGGEGGRCAMPLPPLPKLNGADGLSAAAFIKEEQPPRFGDLVGYWLAGSNGELRPDRLVSAQQAANGPKVPYGTLVHPSSPLRSPYSRRRKRRSAPRSPPSTRGGMRSTRPQSPSSAAAKVKAGETDEKTAKDRGQTRTEEVKRAEADVQGEKGTAIGRSSGERATRVG